MRLITLNTWGGRIAHKLIPFLAKQAPTTDIICLQEVLDVSDADTKKQEWKDISSAVDQHAGIENRRTLDLYWKIKTALPEFNSNLSVAYSSGNERLATFIKKDLAIEKCTYRNLAVIKEDVYGVPFELGSPFQYSRIKGKDADYNICNIHGLWQHIGKEDTPERIKQSESWIKESKKLDGRSILCGDFNLAPETQSIALLEKAGFVNLIKEYGIKTTRNELYASKKGKFADYIFVSKDIKVSEFGVIDEAVSDHLPLCVEFS